MSRAFPIKSFSHSDLPIGLPCAARNVLAMPPPMISVSTFDNRWPSRSSLVEILAPPTIAATGRAGVCERRSQCIEFGLHGASGISRQPDGAMALTERVRGARPRMRRRRIDRRARRASWRSPGSFFSSLGMKAGVLQAKNVAIFHRWHGLSASGPMQSSAKVNRPPDDLRDFGGDRAERLLRIALPSGRPKCDSRMTLAPLSVIS